jgi:hypothetical protein
MCDQWDDDQGQKKSTPNWSLEVARWTFDEQAKNMPTNVRIRAMVLDVRLR